MILFVFVSFVAVVLFVQYPSGLAVLFPPFAAFRTCRRLTRSLLITLGVCLAANLAVLLTISSADVRTDSDEIAFYLAITAAWLVLSVFGFEYLGISFRDDVVSRRNPAAAVAICGLMAGESLCLAGSHTGNGPGQEAVLICAVLSTVSLFVSWTVFNSFSGIVDRVSVERDLGAGIRSAGFLGGGGAILGASVAGDWTSLETTLRDFVRFCWPILFLIVAAVVVERAAANRRLNQGAANGLSLTYAGIAFSASLIYAVRVWSRA
ncbi:MAG TPA: hypothetical protein VKP58_09665 [Candidatus Acidoferrum sp.]|nr:hypothetical protein [Candidatus Acidoferrum sp.]